MAHLIRARFLGFLAAAGLLLPAAAWAGDEELFAGLIPGEPLTDEELSQYYGRGLMIIRVPVIERVGTEIVEFEIPIFRLVFKEIKVPDPRQLLDEVETPSGKDALEQFFSTPIRTEAEMLQHLREVQSAMDIKKQHFRADAAISRPSAAGGLREAIEGTFGCCSRDRSR